MIDEPSSYLDVRQRLKAAKVLKHSPAAHIVKHCVQFPATPQVLMTTSGHVYLCPLRKLLRCLLYSGRFHSKATLFVLLVIFCPIWRSSPAGILLVLYSQPCRLACALHLILKACVHLACLMPHGDTFVHAVSDMSSFQTASLSAYLCFMSVTI